MTRKPSYSRISRPCAALLPSLAALPCLVLTLTLSLSLSSCSTCSTSPSGAEADWTIEESVLELHTMRLDGGWGYYLTRGGDTVIWQPYIPSLPGVQPFATEDDASCVGQLVVDKLRRGDDPGLTPSEVKAVLGVE